MPRNVVVLLTGLLFAGAAWAQPVDFAGTELRLGTDKTSVLATLSNRFEVVPGLDGYSVFRGQDGDRLGEPLGVVRFDGGRLAQVQRRIGSFEGEAAARTVRRLIAAFAEAPAGKDPHAIQTRSGGSSNATTSRVVFNLPDRQIVIDVYDPTDPDAPASAEVAEHFRLND